MRGYITYIKPKNIVCRTCSKPMDYWIPGLDLSKHEHDECLSQRLADKIKAEVNRMVTEVRESLRGDRNAKN